VNVYEYAVKMALCDSFEYEPPGKEQEENTGGDGEKRIKRLILGLCLEDKIN
jgi:hypothetical protein